MLQISKDRTFWGAIHSGETRFDGQQKHCYVHDFSEVMATTHPEEFNCVKTKTQPSVDICVYPDKMDIWVSRLINKNGLYHQICLFYFVI